MDRVRLAMRAACLVLCLGLPGRAMAGDEADATELPPILVTAQKSVQDERDVPMSISVIGARELGDARIRSTDDVARHMGNVHFTGNYLYIRGIGSTELLSFEPSCGIFVDGVYLGRATAAFGPLLDLEQVEVVRGPQGAMLGKNTIGGAVLMSTAQPGEQLGGTVEGISGAIGERTARVTASIPIRDSLSLRLAGLDDRRDGEIVNSTAGRVETAKHVGGARGKLAWRPDGPLSAWLSSEGGTYFEGGSGYQLSTATADSMAVFRRYDPATETDVGDSHTAQDEGDGLSRRRGRYTTLNLEYQAGSAAWTSLSNVARSRYRYFVDADFSPAPLITNGEVEDYGHWSEELRVNGALGSVAYVAGVYYLRSRLDTRGLIVAFPDGSAGVAAAPLPPAFAQLAPGDVSRDESRKDFRQRDHSTSLFGQAVWTFHPKWTLTTGLRWTAEHKGVHATNSFENTGATFTEVLGEQPYDVTRARTEKQFSPRVALQFDASDELAVYGSYASGFKGGGFNDLAPTPNEFEFEPERSATGEAGIKSSWLHHRLAANVTVFDTRYDDLQVNTFDGTHFFVTNAAEARNQGFELETRWQVTQGWSTTLDAAYLRARYTSFPNAPPIQDASSSPATPAPPHDLTGQPLARAPRWSGALGVQYVSPPLFRDWMARGTVYGLYRGKAFLDVDDDPIDSQRAYCLLNAAIRLGPADQHWMLNLSGQNLTDEVVVIEADDVPLFSGDHYARIQPRRSWSGSLELRW